MKDCTSYPKEAALFDVVKMMRIKLAALVPYRLYSYSPYSTGQSEDEKEEEIWAEGSNESAHSIHKQCYSKYRFPPKHISQTPP